MIVLLKDLMTTSALPFLTVASLDLHWPQGALFTGANWSSPAGAVLLQGGPSSGKTTLLRVLAGVVAPTRGRILLQGKPVRLSDVFWAEAESAGSEQWGLPDVWAKVAKRFPGFDEAALARHLEGFALAPHLAKQLFMLSTGTRRKVWLAAALASGAPLTLIDEPLAGLDWASVRYLAQAVSDAVASGAERAVVLAHDDALDGVSWAAHWQLPDAAL